MFLGTLATRLLENRVLLAMTIAVILAAGLSAFSSLPRIEDPRITNRRPIVLTRLPGASAERVESLISEKLENALQEVAEIKSIDSASRTGISILSIELHDAIDDTGPAFSEIRDKLVEARAELPFEASAPFLDDKRGAVAFSLVYAIQWQNETTPQLGILARLGEDFADQLRNVSGTELVRLYGMPEEEITVSVDGPELAALGLTQADVASRVAAADSKVPAGVLRAASSGLLVEVKGELDTLERIESIPLSTASDGAMVRLGDVSLVTKDWRTPTREVALTEGRRSIFVAARMAPAQRADRWSGSATRVADAFANELGGGVELVKVFDQTTYTRARLRELGLNLAAGAAVIMAVMCILMGWRSALLVGTALPLVGALVLFALGASGGTLQQMSIFGMIIALGILIDNAIVVVDDVRHRRSRGLAPGEAAAQSVSHLATPLGASTLTTVLAFLPIMLLPGNVGDFVSSIGTSVILALVASFVVSLTLVAALAALYGQPIEDGRWWQSGVRSDRLAAAARRGLGAAFRRPKLALAVAIALPFIGFALAPTLGSQFFPRIDRNMFDIQLWLPQEASLEHTTALVAEAEEILRAHAKVRDVSWLVGGSFPSVFYNLVMRRDDSPYYAQGIVYADDFRAVKQLIPTLQRELDAELPGAQILVRQFAQGPPIEADIEIQLEGPSIAVLQSLGDRVRSVVARQPEVLHTRASMERGTPKVWIDVNEDEARLAGLRLTDVAGQLEGQLEGRIGGSVVEGLEELPVRVRFANARRGDLMAIASSRLVSSSHPDEWVPLPALGEVTLRPEIAEVSHCKGVRCNVIRGYVRNDALAINVVRRVVGELEREGIVMPAGFRLTIGGDSEEQADAIGKLGLYLPVIGVVMLATLVLSFGSFRLAGLLVAVAGLSVGLALLSTWVARFPISFNSILGTLGLMGVALNDSIVVLAALRANPSARRGDINEVVEEVMGASGHVLATTLTTIGGFLPFLVLIGGDFWPPLAIVLAGGVAGATLIALVLIPAAYLLIGDRAEAETDQRGISIEMEPGGGSFLAHPSRLRNASDAITSAIAKKTPIATSSPPSVSSVAPFNTMPRTMRRK